jgi:hypothetical protein
MSSPDDHTEDDSQALDFELPPRHGDVGLSHVSLSFTGDAVTLWSDPSLSPSARSRSQTDLQLQPGKPVVVGRQHGGEVPYLDQNYVPTDVVPEIGRSILTHGGDGPDRCVSRGHFLLKAVAGGVALINGVPSRQGGFRPPLNGTWLLAPVRRRLHDGEAYLIRQGESAQIELPNGTRVLIEAS